MSEAVYGHIDRRNTRGWPKNDRQARWAWLHVMDGLSAHAAALEAGYTPETAKAKSHTLVKRLRPYLEHLQRLKNETADRQFEVTVERLLREVAAIGFADRISFVRRVQVKGQPHFIGIAPDLLTPMQRLAVRGWKETSVDTDDGVEVNYDYELHDKMAALTFLGRHLGMLSDVMIVARQAQQRESRRPDYSDVPSAALEEALALIERARIVTSKDAGPDPADAAAFLRAEARKLMKARRSGSDLVSH